MLPQSLGTQPRPIYLVASDEPLLLRDWLDAARNLLREQGYEEILQQVVENVQQFDWNGLLEDGQNLSLFASRKAQILRLPGCRPGTTGARVLTELCRQPSEDTLYIVTTARLDAAAKKSAWLKAIRESGEVCELQPVYPDKLPGWIRQRARGLDLQLDEAAAAYLADLTEGNLLATAQELEKLRLSCGEGAQIDEATIRDAVGRSARYSQYLLVDACLAGDARRAFRIVDSLIQEGLSTVQLQYALTGVVSNLLRLKSAQQQGGLTPGLWSQLRIWQSKQRLYQAALPRFSLPALERLLQSCASLDRISKGQQPAEPGDDWRLVRQIVRVLSGLRLKAA